MWNVDQKRMHELYWLDQSTMNSPLTFPRLPPSIISQPGGLSRTGKLKEDIIRDNASMLAKLYDFHASFQKYASGLFELTPSNQFGPGHPMHSKMHSVRLLESENQQLRKENDSLRRDLEKFRKK